MSEAIGRRLRPETRQRLAKAAIALLFALIFLLGLCTVDDYGRNWDEKGEINIYRIKIGVCLLCRSRIVNLSVRHFRRSIHRLFCVFFIAVFTHRHFSFRFL